MTDQIAFIGVGNMGNPMADQLVKAGKKVKAYDVSPEMIKKAKDANLDVVDTLDEVLEGCKFCNFNVTRRQTCKISFFRRQRYY